MLSSIKIAIAGEPTPKNFSHPDNQPSLLFRAIAHAPHESEGVPPSPIPREPIEVKRRSTALGRAAKRRRAEKYTIFKAEALHKGTGKPMTADRRSDRFQGGEQ
ncbi:MAG: hypothetical protein ACRC1K_17525 [Planctomycetia bacterium]